MPAVTPGCRKVVQSVSLLLDYLRANQNCFNDPKSLFTAFTQRLHRGTIGADGLDPSDLYWFPKNAQNARQLVLLLSEFSDWLAERSGTAMPLNPLRPASRYEEMLEWAAYYQRRSRAFLAHTWNRDRSSAGETRMVQFRHLPTAVHSDVKFFPESKIADLLFKGFIVPGRQRSPRIEERLNLRDILITILLHGGGVRVSEAFHLYVHDVQSDPLDPTVAMVRIYHPEEGLAPADWLDAKGNPTACNRNSYLRGNMPCDLVPNIPKAAAYMLAGRILILTTSGTCICMYIGFPETGADCSTSFGISTCSNWSKWIASTPLLSSHLMANVLEIRIPYPPTGCTYPCCPADWSCRCQNGRYTEHGHRHAYGQRVKGNQRPIDHQSGIAS